MIDLAREGATPGEIASVFGCRPETVRNHLPKTVVQSRNMSDPIVGHGVKEFKQERRDLFRRARQDDPQAISELERLGVTGFWVQGEGTHLARNGFSAVTCMLT